MNQQVEARSEQTGTIALALFAVYVIWGSTYLAMRYALEGFPPFLMGGVRYVIAGMLLYGFARARGLPAPRGVEWRSSALVGTLLMAGGNGLVAVAQNASVASGVAAVVVATMPLWAVLFSALWGNRPSRAEIAGLLLGLAGVALLQRGGAFAGSWGGFVAVVIAPMSWALGSVWSARLPLPRGAMASAAQMVSGGLVMLVVGLVSGEQLRQPSARATLALVYLIVFGSLIAFRAFGFLLETTRPAVATSYAFVNPSVALLLGAAVAGEPLSAASVLACALTVLGVVVVTRSRARR